MIAKPPDRHQLAVAILAIATAAIGFGLFGGDVSVGKFELVDGFTAGIQGAKLAMITTAIVCYFAGAISVIRVLREDQITGERLVSGPMQWLVIEMVALAELYLVLLIAELLGK